MSILTHSTENTACEDPIYVFQDVLGPTHLAPVGNSRTQTLNFLHLQMSREFEHNSKAGLSFWFPIFIVGSREYLLSYKLIMWSKSCHNLWKLVLSVPVIIESYLHFIFVCACVHIMLFTIFFLIIFVIFITYSFFNNMTKLTHHWNHSMNCIKTVSFVSQRFSKCRPQISRVPMQNVCEVKRHLF